MRISRPWLWAGAVVGLLALGATLAVSQLLDERRVRHEVEQRLTALVGRPVHVRGPIDYSLVPTIEFDVREVAVDAWPDARASGDAVPLVAIARAQGAVRTASLLSGRVEIGDVRLAGVRVALAVDADGRANWAGLFPEDPPGTPPSEPTRWALASLALVDLAIEYRDARDGTQYALRDAELALGPVELPQPFDVRLRGSAFAGETARATLDARGRAAVDASGGRYALDDFVLDAQLARARPVPVKLVAKRIDYAAAGEGTAAIRGLVVEALGTRTKLEVAVESLAAGGRASGTVALEPFVPREVARALEVPLPPTADASVLGRAHFESRLAYGSGRMELADVQAGLDDTRFTGDVAIVLDPREYRFELAADRIVADRYLKPKKLRDRKPVELPLEFMRGLPATGRLRIGELVVDGARLKGVTVDLGEASQAARAGAAR